MCRALGWGQGAAQQTQKNELDARQGCMQIGSGAGEARGAWGQHAPPREAGYLHDTGGQTGCTTRTPLLILSAITGLSHTHVTESVVTVIA